MKLSPFGLFVRKLRLDLGLTLKDMATSLGVSSAYMSSVELGEKSLSSKMSDQVLAYFAPKISKEQYEELRGVCGESLKAIPVSTLDAGDRNLVAAFARRLSEGQGVPQDVLNWIKSGGLDGNR